MSSDLINQNNKLLEREQRLIAQSPLNQGSSVHLFGPWHFPMINIFLHYSLLSLLLWTDSHLTLRHTSFSSLYTNQMLQSPAHFFTSFIEDGERKILPSANGQIKTANTKQLVAFVERESKNWWSEKPLNISSFYFSQFPINAFDFYSSSCNLPS